MPAIHVLLSSVSAKPGADVGRKKYWLLLVLYFAIAVAFAWATNGRLSGLGFNLVLIGEYGVLAWLVGRRFEDMGLLPCWGYVPVFACSLGLIILKYAADYALLGNRYPWLVAGAFYFLVFGPLVLVGAAGVSRSRDTR